MYHKKNVHPGGILAAAAALKSTKIMKPHGSKAEHEKERNDNLMRAYHRLIEQSPYICLARIYKEVVNMPAKRFWVTEERAAIVISAMMRGKQLKDIVGCKRKPKREMFQEIYNRAMEIRKTNPSLSLSDLAFKVVHQPAPKFYMTPGYARSIIFQYKRQWYEERKRKLRHLF